jgi:hypothetical protein
VSCAIYCIWKQRDQKTRSMLSVKIAALQIDENYLYKCRIEFREILGEIGVIVVRDGRGVLCNVFHMSIAEFQSSKRPPAEMQDTFDDPEMKDSGRMLWTEEARLMRFSLSTLPWVLLSRIILREFWRKDL